MSDPTPGSLESTVDHKVDFVLAGKMDLEDIPTFWDAVVFQNLHGCAVR